MVSRNWTGNFSNDFEYAYAWSPVGTPQAGDVLTISAGNRMAINETLQGFTIDLGGTGGLPGPALVIANLFVSAGYPYVDDYAAPDPTLTLTNSTVGSNTQILVPAVSGFSRPWQVSTPNSATIQAAGAINDGTIETAGSALTRGGTLYVSLKPNGKLVGGPTASLAHRMVRASS